MKAISLLYHDVVTGGDYSSSGFGGGDANIYKLDRIAFERHLAAIARVLRRAPATIRELMDAPNAPSGETPPVLLTFDDGGASAYTLVADLLEQRGWRGHFFIVTDFIGTAAFLTAPQIRSLHERGHVIGSHSCSHPLRISHLPQVRILEEWRVSADKLGDILGVAVDAASVPRGFFSNKVAGAAAEAGISFLFNSEPVLRVRQVEGCHVLGRFGLQQSDPEQTAAAFASAAPGARLRRWAFWNAKKVAKLVGGEVWLSLRERLLSD